jgi:chromosome segregation ATPase
MDYYGECGYNEILYPNEAQTRKLLTWLVTKLPRPETENEEENLTRYGLLMNRVREALGKWSDEAWCVPYLASASRSRTGTGSWRENFKTVPEELMLAGDMAPVYERCAKEDGSIAPSIFHIHALDLALESSTLGDADEFSGTGRQRGGMRELSNKMKDLFKSAVVNSHKLAESGGVDGSAAGKSFDELLLEIASNGKGGSSGKGTRFEHAAEYSEEAVVDVGNLAGSGNGPDASSLVGMTAEEAQAEQQRLKDLAEKEKEDELIALGEQVSKMLEDIKSLERMRNHLASKRRQLESEVPGSAQTTEDLEKMLLIKKKTLEMLPEGQKNIDELKGTCSKSAKKLMVLAQEWEKVRLPLVEKLRSLENVKRERAVKMQEMVEEMKRLRDEMQNLKTDMAQKKEKMKLVEGDLKKLPNNINRTLYTQRIMDIIDSIRRLNEGIGSVTADIRIQQKRIQSLTQSVQRADALTEEKVYSKANQTTNNVTMGAYKVLAHLRSKFDKLVETVDRIGQAEKAAWDLETKVDQEQSRVSSNNLELVMQDLKVIKLENQELRAKIQGQ